MVLEVFGKIQRQGQLYLVLVLPDGSRSYIPAAWTDFAAVDPADSEADAPELPIASTLHLWLFRQRIDALLHRTQQHQSEGPTTATVDGGAPSVSANLS